MNLFVELDSGVIINTGAIEFIEPRTAYHRARLVLRCQEEPTFTQDDYLRIKTVMQLRDANGALVDGLYKKEGFPGYSNTVSN